MNYYLIDLENVHSRGLQGADLLKEEDRVVIFYSSVVNTVTKQDEERILMGGASIDIKSVNVHTKNALDFELSMYVGMILSESEVENIFIISEDNGYRAVLDAGNRVMKESGRKSGGIFLCRTILEGWYLCDRPPFYTSDSTSVSVKSLRKQSGTSRKAALIADRLCIDAKDFTQLVTDLRSDSRKLYLGLLQAYGRAKGLEAYRALKMFR